MIRDIFQLSQAAQTPVQPDPDCFRDGASTISLGNHFQHLITFIVKKFLHYMYSESSFFQFKTIIPCWIAAGTWPHLSYKLPLSIEERKQGFPRIYALPLCLYWPNKIWRAIEIFSVTLTKFCRYKYLEIKSWQNPLNQCNPFCKAATLETPTDLVRFWLCNATSDNCLPTDSSEQAGNGHALILLLMLPGITTATGTELQQSLSCLPTWQETEC